MACDQLFGLSLAPPACTFLVQNPIVIASLVGGCIALMVGLLTFAGVGVSLHAATRRMRAELAHSAGQGMRDREETAHQADLERRHSASEAQAERLATARRTVYLEAAADIVKANTYIGKFASEDLTKLDLGAAFSGVNIAAAKIYVVGEQATALKARAVTGGLTKLMVKALPMVLPLADMNARGKFHQDAYAETQIETKRILAAMANHNEMRVTDQAAFHALNVSFDNAASEARKHTDTLAAIQAESTAIKVAYAAFVMEEWEPLAHCLDDLVFAIRTELGISTDFEQMQDQTIATLREMHEAMQAIFRVVPGKPKPTP